MTRPSGTETPARVAEWGGLEVAERGTEGAPFVFVLLHGFGAAGDDLVPLGQTLADETYLRFVMPAAPIELAPGHRAWFRLDGRERQAEIDDAVAAIEGVIATLGRRGIDRSHVFVGGFSQGGMLALEIARRNPERLAGVAVLSGRAIALDGIDRAHVDGLEIFASHGRSDARIPFADGIAFLDPADRAGARLTRVQFDGGHTIPPEVVAALPHWIIQRITRP